MLSNAGAVARAWVGGLAQHHPECMLLCNWKPSLSVMVQQWGKTHYPFLVLLFRSGERVLWFLTFVLINICFTQTFALSFLTLRGAPSARGFVVDSTTNRSVVKGLVNGVTLAQLKTVVFPNACSLSSFDIACMQEPFTYISQSMAKRLHQLMGCKQVSFSVCGCQSALATAPPTMLLWAAPQTAPFLIAGLTRTVYT